MVSFKRPYLNAEYTVITNFNVRSGTADNFSHPIIKTPINFYTGIYTVNTYAESTSYYLVIGVSGVDKDGNIKVS